MKEAGVLIEVCPLCLKTFGQCAEESIGGWFPGARWMRTAEKLRKAVKAKAARYGRMKVPFVVAVGLYEPVDRKDVLEALFGDVVYKIPFCKEGMLEEPVPSRKPNGVWWGPRGSQNTRVSAVLIVDRFFPWSVAATRPVVFHNPQAKHPLKHNTLPFSYVRVDHKKLDTQEGRPAREILGLPLGWLEQG